LFLHTNVSLADYYISTRKRINDDDDDDDDISTGSYSAVLNIYEFGA
jgi:hypothetical protein